MDVTEVVPGPSISSSVCSGKRKLDDETQNDNTSKRKKIDKVKVFKFGNYNRYYGYRNPEHSDKRLSLMNIDWFQGKDVLDIGCNVGEITLEIAKNYIPNRIVGIDIDRQLIFHAKKNLKEFSKDVPCEFVKKVHFVHGNYVPDNDDVLDNVTEEFDVILALSITKWIHLNFGDVGLKRFFKKIFLQLRPGGILILEPQQWSSYKKKCKITTDIHNTYKSLKFLPHEFTSFLVSHQVGFGDCQSLGFSDNCSTGFKRPIYLYKKYPKP